ncbi:MAG: acyltransferase [Epsilonproteobacteria bacterium]|nr:acyltransferase [Campylobacterota bacterium]NPA64100.1 lysophospholipid acyltransferase family protein [Campylobacterota bacterium]
MRAFREWIEYWLVRGLLELRLPKKALYKLFERLADLLFFVDAKRRRLSEENLRLAGFDPAIAKSSYRQMARSVAEIVLMWQRRFDFSAIEGDVRFKSDKPKLFVTAHFGNWEALAHHMAQKGVKVAIVGREGNNKLIDRRIVRPFRQMYGNRLIYKEGALKHLIKALKQGENVGLLIDQKAGRAGVPTTFFDRPCKTVPSVALLAKRFDVEVVPLFLAREGEKFRIIQKEFACEGCDEVAFTQKLNDILEDVVRAYPDQWFWMHNRWKM